ncbi:MAG: hypothetical protein ACI352_03180 [Elusimicrobiaceae bacterium]
MSLYSYPFVFDAYNPNQPRDDYGRWTSAGLSAEAKDIIKHFPEWLRRAVTFALIGTPVAEISGKEFQKDGVPLTQKVSAYYKQAYNNQVQNPELGTVEIETHGVKSDIGHGLSGLKAAAFMCVPQVIEKGFIFDRQENWKGRGYDTFVLIAPVIISGKRYAEEVIIKKTKENQRLYLHEVDIQEKLEHLLQTSHTQDVNAPAFKLIIAKKIRDYKPINIGQGRYICRLAIRTTIREIMEEKGD